MDTDLTAREIKDIRTRYGLSQQAFARVLGLGEASIVLRKRSEAHACEREPHPCRQKPLVHARLPRTRRQPNFAHAT